jgi:hypothetical protein
MAQEAHNKRQEARGLSSMVLHDWPPLTARERYDEAALRLSRTCGRMCLRNLAALGVSVSLTGDDLVLSPTERVTPDVLATAKRLEKYLRLALET